jgi:hypothetical protein
MVQRLANSEVTSGAVWLKRGRVAVAMLRCARASVFLALLLFAKISVLNKFDFFNRLDKKKKPAVHTYGGSRNFCYILPLCTEKL